MNNIFAYSNGWGHLIITIFFGILGGLLILLPTSDATSKGVGIALITTTSGAWFIPGAAKQYATEVTKGVQGVQGAQGVQGPQGVPGTPAEKIP